MSLPATIFSIPPVLGYVAAIAAALTAIFTFFEKARNMVVACWRWFRNRRAPRGGTHPAESKTPLTILSAEEVEACRPHLYTLHPRICSITDREGGGFKESGDSLRTRAVVATFRMAKPSADGRSTHITARLSYRITTEIGVREISTEIHRVNYGAWLDEDFNSTEMTLTDTKELILLVKENETCVAVQDNRHSVSKRDSPSFHQFVASLSEFYVDVMLVHDKYGVLISYTYLLETNPLAVREIMRVPHLGSQ